MSTSSTVKPCFCASAMVRIMANVPMRLAMKLGVSLARTRPLPSRPPHSASARAIVSGLVSAPATISTSLR